MEGPSSSSSRKRPFVDEDDDSNKQKQKRVRFPKGKKVKAGAPPPEPVAVKEEENEAAPPDLSDPRVAAKERAKRRSLMTTQLFTEDGEVEVAKISTAEVHYQENDTFFDDGIQMEPFNLEKEREEGYFDESGNFVEYVVDKEDKDAWLDSLEMDPKLADRVSTIPNNDDEEQELSSDDIAKMKRRIANALECGETVLQALKRLKGSNDKRVKMSAETKFVFDQLTEDAMRLMETGDYNVYHEEQEVFEREAEGYEALARARNSAATEMGDDAMDIFADEDDVVVANSEQNNHTSVPSVSTSSQLADDNGTYNAESSWAGQSDYVYDEASGYYYSSSLGYYYEPSTGLFCSASSGQWYQYNESTGVYDEVHAEAEAPSTES